MARYMKFEDVLDALNESRCSDCSNEESINCSICQTHEVYRQILTKPVLLDVVPKSEVAREIFEEIEKNECHDISGKTTMYMLFAEEFAELKKKYTEDKR